jgi:hypothetical protein
MKFQIKKCFTCGALGIGPHAVKLWPFEDRLYCKEHYKEPLDWHESRGNIVMALMFEVARPVDRKRFKSLDWRGYLTELCLLAGWALKIGDKRTFTHYFSRAMYAWSLKQEQAQ